MLFHKGTLGKYHKEGSALNQKQYRLKHFITLHSRTTIGGTRLDMDYDVSSLLFSLHYAYLQDMVYTIPLNALQHLGKVKLLDHDE